MRLKLNKTRSNKLGRENPGEISFNIYLEGRLLRKIINFPFADGESA